MVGNILHWIPEQDLSSNPMEYIRNPPDTLLYLFISPKTIIATSHKNHPFARPLWDCSLITAIPPDSSRCPPVKNAFSDHGNVPGTSWMCQNWLMKVKEGCTLSKILLQTVLLLQVCVLLLHGNINIKRRYKSLPVPPFTCNSSLSCPLIHSDHLRLHSLLMAIPRLTAEACSSLFPFSVPVWLYIRFWLLDCYQQTLPTDPRQRKIYLHPTPKRLYPSNSHRRLSSSIPRSKTPARYIPIESIINIPCINWEGPSLLYPANGRYLPDFQSFIEKVAFLL